MAKPLTKRQREILEYIKVYSQLNKISPSLSEIKRHFNLSAISTVHEHIKNLTIKGYVTHEINQARGISIINEIDNTKTLEINISKVLTETNQLIDYRISKTIFLNKELLLIKSPENYMGIMIENSSYQEPYAICQGDFLIIELLSEQTTLQHSNIVLTKNSRNLYSLANYNDTLNIIGKLILQFRNYN
jgi:SOS-response transcriptional repressor LexA